MNVKITQQLTPHQIGKKSGQLSWHGGMWATFPDVFLFLVVFCVL